MPEYSDSRARVSAGIKRYAKRLTDQRVVMEKEKYVLEWSPRQQCFRHITDHDMIAHNLRTLAYTIDTDEPGPGYVPIGIFSTKAELSEFREAVLKDLGAHEIGGGE